MTDKPQEHRQPREFWITDEGAGVYDAMISSRPMAANSFCVIEKSAFTLLQSQYADLAKEFNDLRNKYENLCRAIADKKVIGNERD